MLSGLFVLSLLNFLLLKSKLPPYTFIVAYRLPSVKIRYIMRQLIVLISFLFAFSMSSFSQYDDAYRAKFMEIRSNLGGGKTGQAFLLLKDLYALDSLNHYTNYLMGVCYTEQNIRTEKSIRHLEYAVKNILPDYGYIPYNEKRAPMFAWYYLTKAYSQNGYCAKAKMARNEFVAVYGKDKSDYFIKNVDNFLIQCEGVHKQLENKNKKSEVVTKHVEYTTSSPLYSVQVGAFKDLVPVRDEFNDLKNVEAFLDKEGMIRYVVGRFLFKNQALELQKIVAEKGYKDAFVVDVNEARRFSEEVIIVDNISFKEHIDGKVDFKVQVGAFKDSIPNYLLKLYLSVEGIKEFRENGLTVLAVGNYNTYEEAEVKKQEMITIGIPDAFIVAYNKGHKISLKAAKKYAESNPAPSKEESEESDKKGKKKKKK